MNSDDVAKLATVIADNANMGERMDKVEKTLGDLVVSNTAISTQLSDFFERDKKKKEEHDEKIKSQEDKQAQTDVEIAKIKTKLKWGAGIGGSSALAALINKFFF